MNLAYRKHETIFVFPLPKPMDDVDLHQVSDIFIECIHEKRNVVKVVEFPALGYQRIA